jgi:hypothetical protein
MGFLLPFSDGNTRFVSGIRQEIFARGFHARDYQQNHAAMLRGMVWGSPLRSPNDLQYPDRGSTKNLVLIALGKKLRVRDKRGPSQERLAELQIFIAIRLDRLSAVR